MNTERIDVGALRGHTPGYVVTPDGRVFSVEHNWRGLGRRELHQDLNASGYPSVRLTIDGKRTRYAVHVLVARKYLPPRPSPRHEVRHLDGNKMNASVDNLAMGHPKGQCGRQAATRPNVERMSHSEAIKRGLERRHA